MRMKTSSKWWRILLTLALSLHNMVSSSKKKGFASQKPSKTLDYQGVS